MTECDSGQERFAITYFLSGAKLDVDDLLTAARPITAHEIWRRGDPVTSTRRRRIAGVRIDVLDHPSRFDEAAGAILAFLTAEDRFLRAAAKRVSPDVRSVLQCALWVYAKMPSTIRLDAPVLRELADRSIDWEVTGYPCTDEEEVGE